MSESTWINCTNCDSELHCGECGVPYIPPPLTCNCGQCGRMHDSDCAVHNEPAMPRGACDCVDTANEREHTFDKDCWCEPRVVVVTDWDSMIDDVMPDIADCVIHGSYGTGCDFDWAEAKKVILDAIKREAR